MHKPEYKLANDIFSLCIIRFLETNLGNEFKINFIDFSPYFAIFLLFFYSKY